MVPSHLITLEPFEVFGIIGALIYAGSYLMVALDRLTSWSPVYYACKLVAACLVLSSLWFSFNLAATMIQVFFVLVSILGLYRHVASTGAPFAKGPRTADHTRRSGSTAPTQ